jgi:general secretion pathway protein B
MSYILDALRRADSERERAAIPSIHAQPVPRASADVRAHAGPRPWVWVVVGVLVVVLGQWGWQMLRSPEPEAAGHASAGGTAPVEAGVTTSPGNPPAAETTGAPAGEATAGGASAEAAPSALPAFPPQDPPAPRTATAPAAPPAARKPAPQPRAAAPAAPAPAPEATVAPPPAEAPVLQDPVYAMAELPPDVRQALPRLQVGGSVYSEDPGSRFVILNGLIFHENDKPAAGVLLERIELKSAVLSFRGYRFRLSF